MYPNYNMAQNSSNMYQNSPYFYDYQNRENEDERFIPGGFIAPFLLGGLAGYAIGGRPNNNYPTVYPYNYYYNNFYYPPYYYY